MDWVEVIPRKELESDYDKKFAERQAVANELANSIRKILEKEKIRHSLKYRVKKFKSYYNKLLDRYQKYENTDKIPEITDIFGFRIVCPFLEELDRVEIALKSSFVITEVERKGDDHSFKEFGYQSIHLLIEIPQELLDKYTDIGIKVIEIQIRTILQDAWSEVEHELVYKADFNPYDKFLRRKLAALNANLTLSDIIFQEIRDYQRKLHVELKQRRKTFTEIIDADLPYSVTQDKTEENNDNEIMEDELYNIATVSIDELLLKALTAHNRQQYDHAQKLYDVILERNIDFKIKAIILIHRGMAQFAAGEYKKALDDFKCATEIEPQNSRALYYQGTVYRLEGSYSEAVDVFKSCINIDPGYCGALFGLSQTYANLGDYTEALKMCDEVLELEPDFEKAIAYKKYLLKEMEV